MTRAYPRAPLPVPTLIALALAAGAARAQWTAIDLTPPGMQTSSASAVLGDTQAGSAGGHAGLWHGTPDSFIDFNPPGATSSLISAISADEQVGAAQFGGTWMVGLWRGTPDSWVPLASAGTCGNCFAMTAVGNGTELGWIGYYSYLWHGTAGSGVLLNPAGASDVKAYGGDGTHQVGMSEFDTAGGEWTYRAGVWTGTANSWTSLQAAAHPFEHAGATAISDGQIVGFVTSLFWTFNKSRPALWTDLTAAPTVLGPNVGEAYSVSHGWQAGGVEVYTVGLRCASVWHGTAASWENLFPSLPPGRWWLDNEAKGISTDGTTMNVVGYANAEDFGGTNFGAHAIVWTRPVCYPNCDYSTTPPLLNVSDFLCFESKFAAGDMYANCDGSTAEPRLNVNDFLCFLTKFAAGCND